MTISGIYFIPQLQATSSAYPLLLEMFARHTSGTNASPLPSWQLIHHLCVDTSSLLPSNPSSPVTANQPRRCLQFLALPHHRQGSMYIGASSPRKEINISATPVRDGQGNSTPTNHGEMTIITVPTSQVEDFFQTVQKKMEPLWSYRMAVRVDNGVGYEIGDWRIRVGELRQMSGGPPRGRGVVVETTLVEGRNNGYGEDGIDAEAKEAMLKNLWDQLGLQGGRSFINGPGMEESDSEELSLVRQYMDLLKFTRMDASAKG